MHLLLGAADRHSDFHWHQTARSASTTPDMPTHTRCSVCGREHMWWKRQTWLADAPPERGQYSRGGSMNSIKRTAKPDILPQRRI